MKQSSYLLIIFFVSALFGSLNSAGQAPQPKQDKESIQVFPNPIDQKGNIEIVLEHDAHALVELYNLAGKKVKLVSQQPLYAGKNRIVLEAGELKEGFYFCKVSTSQWVRTKRFLVKR
ncbi:MAG: T9SS type A sorting domain-containing protein [Bacteroidales bacterium]|nr:T9SS type A sorting domain-containing protein [Bacteroidales bacterium]